ncbi:hypothetical protein ACFFX0_27645 [Citricoccus parietis]|uniref:Uncharacterized protein n=1 Tax=Citricoccus parietis TaxID=592307 RepID=A0ABV5G736_9MICC
MDCTVIRAPSKTASTGATIFSSARRERGLSCCRGTSRSHRETSKHNDPRRQQTWRDPGQPATQQSRVAGPGAPVITRTFITRTWMRYSPA